MDVSIEEVNPTHVSDEDTLKCDIQTKVSNNAALLVNRLPSEIFVVIIALAFPHPSTLWSQPYPCMRFSWVCHHWRSVILGYPIFWRGLVSSREEHMVHPFIKEVLKRSRPVPLEVVMSNSILQVFQLGVDVNRIRMLRMDREGAHLPFITVTHSFPLLEKVFYNTSTVTDLHKERLPRLKAFRVSISRLGNLAIPRNFPNLWWLDLQYNALMPLIPLLEALRNLPNLRVLYLSPLGTMVTDATPATPMIAFPQLEALITGSPISQLIAAPNLIYLEVTKYPADFYLEDYDHFCGFDFSGITRIHATLKTRYGRDYLCLTGNSNLNDSENHFRSHHNLHEFNPNSLFHEVCDSYPNEFYIQFQYQSRTSTMAPHVPFTTCLKKIKNLVEIVFNNCNPSQWSDGKDDSLIEAARATTARRLTLSDSEFSTFCDRFLSDGTVFPHLERLAYSNTSTLFLKRDDCYVLSSLQNLVEKRFTTNSRLLEIELKDFPPVQPDALEAYEKLGLRIIQKARGPLFEF
ncbi:hypothetical protein Clacol_000205 [Clathrus columnatus]|uniref:F-box domain-containing protein n=1 Tax=Clathrus columnatus TaxID=1419009 RepID=A0AAV4ZY15_9AGAM|nr:hypothetical protein Clacol_000205 [Clathrus columnatus]